jgi:hypothetical protein
LNGCEIVELIAVACTEKEVGKVVRLFVQDVGVRGVVGIRGGAVRSAWSVTAKLAGVKVFSVLRVEVRDRLVKVAVFGAYFEAVAAFEKTVVDFGVGDVRTGELRIRGLPSELREPRDSLAV